MVYYNLSKEYYDSEYVNGGGLNRAFSLFWIGKHHSFIDAVELCKGISLSLPENVEKDV